MLYSKSFIFTLREDPKIAECDSHRLLLKGCYVSMISSGIYAYLPLGWRVLNKICGIIRKHMNSAGAQELLMSALQPIEFWQKTGRDKDLSEVMLTVKDRKQRDLCLGPTHEEEITELVRRHVASYKQLPQVLYQIQTKFRDEPRPRFGLVRGCEFIMKDAYSFDIDDEGLAINYEKMLKAYNAIFTECGLNFVMVEADSGVMGGKVSHEFMVPSRIGEDVLFRCAKCGKYRRDNGVCAGCGSAMVESRMIEMGHIFQLGTKYSQAMEALFLDKTGQRQPMIMGCYGIGVSRLLPAIVETNFDDKGIIWPASVSPFDAVLAVLNQTLMPEALELYADLQKQGLDILVDDRDEGAGVKFKDSALLGVPYVIVMGKNYVGTKKIDIEIRKTGEKLSFSRDELIVFLTGG